MQSIQSISDTLKTETYSDCDEEEYLKYTIQSAICDLREHIQDNKTLDPKEKNYIWELVEYVVSHGRFTQHDPEGVKGLIEDVSESIKFSKKQRDKMSSRLKSGKWVIESDSDDGGMYCMYDGPDDPDRYLGHGEFDTDIGYYVG